MCILSHDGAGHPPPRLLIAPDWHEQVLPWYSERCVRLPGVIEYDAQMTFSHLDGDIAQACAAGAGACGAGEIPVLPGISLWTGT